MQIANCKLQIEDHGNAMSPWPHRWAVVLACATFPLVWVGGLVTTTDSGMAVPDWPNTYGYNLFLYPWQEWILGPWALFLEHSHRLIGATVGMITIGLVAVVWRTDSRRWLHWFSVAVLGMVVFHAMVVFTSRSWQRGAAAPTTVPGASQVCVLAAVTCVLAYLQILLGAVLRHVPVVTEPMTFVLAVRFHLLMAAVLSLHALLLVWTVLSRAAHVKPLGRLAIILAGLLILQLMLGAGTWLVKFSIPGWVPSWISLGTSAVQAGGWLQTHVITGHVAVGSLLFVTALALALYSVRLLTSPAHLPTAKIRLEAAV
jgi:cytochrome c oxidase assembly protein subunit 15